MIKKIFFWNQFQLHLGRTVYPEANIPGGPGVRPTGADQQDLWLPLSRRVAWRDQAAIVPHIQAKETVQKEAKGGVLFVSLLKLNQDFFYCWWFQIPIFLVFLLNCKF